jgi:tRNA threonylcarbamoyladenosine biosynthesis protein TsaE
MRLFLEDEAATTALAERFRVALPESLSGLTVLLVGELGAGKSTFARGLIRALDHKGPVPSPTYTLVEPYHLSAGIIYHVDLYRVSAEEELRYLGWNELDDGLRLVEWPERAPALANAADVRLTLSYDGDGRSVQIDALSAQGQELIADIN